MMRPICFAALAFCFIALPFSVKAGGHSTGNGGDAYSLEFTNIATRIEEWLKSHPNFKDVDLKLFSKKIREVTVESTDDELMLDGIRKDALNYPDENLIRISRQAWKSLSNDFQKVGLVAHEFLGLMRINDKDYSISGELTSKVIEVNAPTIGDGLGGGVWYENECGTWQQQGDRGVKWILQHNQEVKASGTTHFNESYLVPNFDRPWEFSVVVSAYIKSSSATVEYFFSCRRSTRTLMKYSYIYRAEDGQKGNAAFEAIPDDDGTPITDLMKK